MSRLVGTRGACGSRIGVRASFLAVDLDGEREVIVRMPTFPFSLDWLPDGRLLPIRVPAGCDGWKPTVRW